MKVLFVSSGNIINGISPIVKRQGESLIKNHLDVSFFTIKGKGVRGYLTSIGKLKNVLKEIQPDIVHAHYSMSAYLATFAGAEPLVVSLMGSDVNSSVFSRLILKFFIRNYWHYTIVKSEKMQLKLDISRVYVIPNGVDTDDFFPRDKKDSMEQLGWDSKRKHILFASDPSRPEKNYSSAEKAIELLNDESIELHSLRNVNPARVHVWINASDVILLTSFTEGSPNVIKEAMACCRPVVATDVGDISWITEKTEGCYVSSSEPSRIAELLKNALEFSEKYKQTKGLSRINELKLDSKAVADKITDIYRKINESP